MTTVGLSTHNGARQAFRLRPVFVVASLIALGAAAVFGAVVGPANISIWGVLLEVADKLPLVSVDSGLDERQSIICGSGVYPEWFWVA